MTPVLIAFRILSNLIVVCHTLLQTCFSFKNANDQFRTVEETRRDHAWPESSRDDHRRFALRMRASGILGEPALSRRVKSVRQKPGNTNLSAVRVPRKNKVVPIFGVKTEPFGSMREEDSKLVGVAGKFIQLRSRNIRKFTRFLDVHEACDHDSVPVPTRHALFTVKQQRKARFAQRRDDLVEIFGVEIRLMIADDIEDRRDFHKSFCEIAKTVETKVAFVDDVARYDD